MGRYSSHRVWWWIEMLLQLFLASGEQTRPLEVWCHVRNDAADEGRDAWCHGLCLSCCFLVAQATQSLECVWVSSSCLSSGGLAHFYHKHWRAVKADAARRRPRARHSHGGLRRDLQQMSHQSGNNTWDVPSLERRSACLSSWHCPQDGDDPVTSSFTRWKLAARSTGGWRQCAPTV